MQRTLHSLILSITIGLGSCCFVPAAIAADAGSSSGESSVNKPDIKPWNRVNGQFRSIYARARTRIKKSLNPLIMVKGNEIIILRDGKSESKVLVSDRYDFFKIVSHIPLAVYVSLYDDTKSSVSDEAVQELTALKASVEEAKKGIVSWNLPDKVRSRQMFIIGRSLGLIEKVLKTRAVSDRELRAFCRAMAPEVLDNAYEAVKIELGNVDKGMKGFKAGITEEEWKNLYVVVMSGHMPRLKERRVQYFLKLFKESKPGHRVIYYEGPPYIDKDALDLVATHILDRHVAIDFFKDPERMHRDLLSDAAKKYLHKNKLEAKEADFADSSSR